MKFSLLQQNSLRNILIAFGVGLLCTLLPLTTGAQFNPEINYQGKLTNASGVAVPDGLYNMNFWLVPTQGGATSTAVWSEVRTSGNRVEVTNGLFSIMLGDVSTLSSVDFDQTLYLGVEIGGISTTTPVWDGEMSPRKILGAVPAAFVAENASSADSLSGIASSSFLRSDEADTMQATSSSPILSVIQNGAGAVARFFSGVTEVFSILGNGNVGVGTSTPSARFTVAGDARITGTSTLATTSISVLNLGTALTAVNGGTGLNTVTQNQLLIGGAGNTWTQIATSSLGLGNGTYLGLTDTQPSFTANRVIFTNSGATALTDSANFTYDGTNLGLGGINGISFGGTRVLSASTTAHNYIFGSAAGANISTGQLNIAIGAETLQSNTSGNQNIAIGQQNSYANVTGSFNTAIGVAAMFANANAARNTAIGHSAGLGTFGQTASADNVFLGYRSGYANTTGSNNTLLGFQSADNLTSGSNNIVIGYDIDIASATGSNQLSIGNLIFGTGVDGTGTSISSGNIGIGSTTPSSRLTVQGVSGTTSNTFRVASSSGATALAVLANRDVEVPGQIISAGIEWTARTAAGDNDSWQAVTYGNGLFVAVGAFISDRVMTSPDGVNWTARSAAGNNDVWYDITYGNGLFVAVGSSTDAVMTSPDGITWTVRSAAGNNDIWQSVTYGNGLFVAVSSNGDRVMTSPDGINWTTRTAAGDDDGWNSVTYGNGLFVAVADSGPDRVMTSPDGISWATTSAAGNNEAWNSVTYGNGLFVAVAGFGNDRVMTSPDGINWTTRTAAGDDDSWVGITYGNGLFVVVGDGGPDRVMTSPDGINWTTRTAAGDDDGWRDVVYGNGIFTAISAFTGTDRVMTSGRTDFNQLAANNILQGGLSIFDTLRVGTTTSAASLFVQSVAGLTPFTIASSTGTAMITLTQAGNFGIGSSSPSSALTVSGNTYISGNLTATATTTLATTSITSLSLGTALTAVNGGTGLSSVTQNQLLIGGAGNTWTQIATSSLGIISSNWTDNGTYLTTLTPTDGIYISGSSTIQNLTMVSATTTNLLATTAFNVAAGGAYQYNGLNIIRASTTLDSFFFGAGSGNLNATGTSNNGFGLNALNGLTTGSRNTAIGDNALVSLTSGDNNTAIGSGALAFSNTTGSNNVAIGEASMVFSSGSGNVAIGNISLYDADGSFNIGIGGEAMRNASGDSNIAIGAETLLNNTSGTENVAVGHRSFVDNVTGSFNTALGVRTMLHNGTSTNNTAIGYEAGFGASGQTASANNVFLGYRSGYANTTGNNNTLLGYRAADNLTSGSNNLVIGYDIDVASTTGSNQLSIGNLIFGTGVDGTGTSISSGNIGIGSTTPSSRLTVSGNTFLGGNLRLTGAFFDANNASGTLGMVLQSTGTSTRWAATSTLGFSAAFSSSAELAAILSDETGTGLAVFNTSPAFVTQISTPVVTATSTLSIDSNTTSALNIGTGANAKTITIGNGTGATSLVLNAGTGAINIGTNAVARTTTIGNATGASSVVINSGTGAINIGTSIAKTITIGNNTGATGLVFNSGSAGTLFSNGNVAMGTTSVTSRLTVQGVAGSADIFRLASSTGSILFTAAANGNIGIGSSTPSSLLTVSGNTYIGGELRLVGALRDGANASGTLGMVLQSTGTSTRWVATSTLGISGGAALFTDAGATTYLTQVGDDFAIGTTTARAKLTVQGTSGSTTDTFRVSSSTGATTFSVLANGDVEVPGQLISAGIEWTARTSPNGNDAWLDITYGNGLFVAVGGFTNDRVMTSPDGINWTSRPAAGSDDAWWGVTYGNGLFVAVGDTSGSADPVMTSPDGINWTARSAVGNNDSWRDVTYGNGLFVAVGIAGDRVMTSPDGINWTAHSAGGDDDDWLGVTYGNGRFVAAVNGDDYILNSFDGMSWATTTVIGVAPQDVVYGNGRFVAVSSFTGNRAISSADGITWDYHPVLGDDDNWNAVTYGNGLFVAVGDGAEQIMTSPDGANWTARNAIGNDDVWLGIAYGNGTFVSVGAFAADIIMSSGKTDFNPLATNNVFQGGIGLSTSTREARLSMENLNFSATSTAAGIDQYFSFNNSVANAAVYGNRSYLLATNTATTSLVGSITQVSDSTTLGNTVRGLEVQAGVGSNTRGENTGVAGFGRTFGVRGTTNGTASTTFEAAGLYGETEGTNSGNAIRGYSASITTAALLKLFQDTSAFTGTGLLMNFGNAGGSFSSTTASRFIDLQNAGTSRFTVGAYGMTTIGDGGTVNNAGLQIGYGGLCVDNDGSCSASTTGRISAVAYHTGNSDLAETYFSNEDLMTGEVVYLKGELSIGRATEETEEKIIGVVTTKPGLLLGFDDTSLTAGEAVYGVALAGRVPVRLSNENGEIEVGDELMLSSLPGVAMKASSTGTVVGVALEDFEEDRAYSDTFINQFGDDLVDPIVTPINPNNDPRLNDGCYYGAGSASGEAPCVPLLATTTDGQQAEAQALAEAEAEAAALEALRTVDSEVVTLPSGQVVRVGQVVMFVSLDKRYLDEEGVAMVAALLATGVGADTQGEDEDERDSVWARLVKLANNFIDGVLSVLTLKADRVEVTEEICVNGVCLTAEDIQSLLDSNSSTTAEPESDPEPTEDVGEAEGEEESEPIPVEEEAPPGPTSTSSEAVTETEEEGESTETELEENPPAEEESEAPPPEESEPVTETGETEVEEETAPEPEPAPEPSAEGPTDG